MKINCTYTFIILLLCIVIQFTTTGQVYSQAINLVPNPSFEKILDYSKLLDNIFSAPPWDTLKNGGGGNPDLFNRFSTYKFLKIPVNQTGYQNTKTGDGYLIIYTYDSVKSFAYRDYPQVKLLDTLQSGKEYCVTFFINLTNVSRFAIDEVGAYFDDGSIHAPYQYWVTKNPQVKSPTGVFMSDTANWMKVQGSFIATGNESYLTLGNFRSDSATLSKYLYYTPFGGPGAEYIFDDISVIESNSNIDAGNDTTIIIGDTITLGKSIEGMPVEWLDVNGNLLVSSSTIKVHPTSATKYITKMDLCGFISYDTITVSTVVGMDEIRGSEKSFTIQPNPNDGSFKIQLPVYYKNIELTITNVTGIVVFRKSYKNVADSIELSEKLKGGIYFINIFNNQTQQNETKKLVIE